MNFRAMMVSVLMLGGCGGCLAPVDVGGNDAGRCDVSSCLGCCEGSVCRSGTTQAQCGSGAASCAVCSAGDSCQSGVCAAPGLCTLPSSVTFDVLLKGETSTRTVEINNTSGSAVTATIGAFTSANGGDNAFSSPQSSQTIAVPAGTSVTVSVTFAPTLAGDYSAQVTMRVWDACPEQVILLKGSAVDQLLTWAPGPLDFGFVTPGVERSLPVTFTNHGARPVQVSNLTASTSEYRVVDSQPIVIPGFHTRDVRVGAKPSSLGPRPARLSFTTDLASQPSGAVALKVYGGGPDIDAPSRLDFGSVSYFAAANPPSYASIRLTLQNVGVKPVPPDPAGNLHLGAGGTGVIYWDVRVKPFVPNNTADLGELCVGEVVNGACSNKPRAGSYDPAVGVEAGGLGGLDIPIRVTPISTGVKDWEVTFYSNDPDEPAFVVAIHANSVVVPPCQYSLRPQTLNFGLVPSGSTRDLGLKLTNPSQIPGEVCLVSGLSLSSGSHSAFSLVGGPLTSMFLDSGEQKMITVRFAPAGTAPLAPTGVTGQLEFSISNPTFPSVTIPLNATLGPSCLNLVPSQVDFGTVANGCSSADRAFLAYNTCTSAVTVNASLLQQPNSDFIGVSTAGIAAGTLIQPGAAPAPFILKYHPTDLGPDSTSFLIKVLQASQVVDYVVPLAGTGDAQGLNSDVVLSSGSSTFPLPWSPDLTGGKTLLIKVNGVATPATTLGGATVWTYQLIGNQVVFEPLYAPQPAQKVTATFFVACLP